MVIPMSLNPEFQKAMRGYRVEEVDEFVNQISAAYEQVRRELLVVKDENARLTKQLEYFQAIESSLNKALVAAQQKAEEIVNNAQDEVNGSLIDSRERLTNINTEIAQILAGAAEKSRQIEEEAHQKAEEILLQVQQQAGVQADRYAQTMQRVVETRQSLIRTLGEFVQQLDSMDSGELVAVAASADSGLSESSEEQSVVGEQSATDEAAATGSDNSR
ncbi:MAG: DivIVA domain-containing protein [Peptococcaceae bacterium]|nr:DivIVA domain-containing protein [Peptococcaceae bacterium]